LIKENKIFDVVYLFRLLMRQIHFLIIVPVLLATTVFLLTRNQPGEYSSKTIIYTGLASGYSIESQGDSRIDFFGVNNAFDNLINIIKSRNTIERVGVMLLSQHLMLDDYNNNYINREHYLELMSSVPEEVLALVNKESFEETYANLMDYKNSSDVNYVVRLLNLNHPHYSVKKISQIRVRRIQNSDLLEITYNSNDAGVCQQTLIFLTETFIDNYTGLKERQTDAVVRYFEDQLKKSEGDLDNAEDALLQFNKKNNVINYNEQTKFIASQKEDLELEYQRTLMTLKGAEAVIGSLEGKLDAHSKLVLTSEEIISKRNQLGEITGRLALIRIGSEADSLDTESDAEALLNQQAFQLKKELREAVDSLYMYSSVKSGLSTRKIFDSWLNNVIIFEETRASLAVLDDRVEEFRRKYARFAPLGANLKRIERKINVNEQEYLSLLHSLALAKLKQQNIELSSNLKVLDEPFLPIKPLPSKRKFLIVIAFMGGFVFVVFLILASEYLDRNIKNHTGAHQKTGLEVAGMYPVMLGTSKKIDMQSVKERAVDLMIKKVQLTRPENGERKKPHIIMIFSTRDGEGKSTITRELLQGLSEYGFKSLFLNYKDEEKSETDKYDYLTYDSRQGCFSAKDFNDIVYNGKRKSWNNYDFVFWEVPSITQNFYPFNLVEKVDSSLLICRANRVWTVSDSNALSTMMQIKAVNPEAIVNGVDIYEMESIVGELPRKRGFIRVFVKRLLKLQLRSKKSL